MSDFNKRNHEEDLDESIDFMMKKRKQNKEPSASTQRASAPERAVPRSVSGANGATPRGAANGANGAAPRGAANGVNGAAPRGAVNGAGGAVPRSAANGANGATLRGTVNGATPRGAVNGVNGAAPRGAANGVGGTAPRGAVNGVGGTAPRGAANGAVPGGSNGGAGSVRAGGSNGGAAERTTSDSKETKNEFVTSGQRIVPKERSEDGYNGVRRPITIKRTNEEVDDQPTRKTDISEKVAEGKGKKKRGGKESSDLGSELVINMVSAVIYLVFIAVISAVLSVFVINIGNDVFAFVKSDELVEVTIPENATTADVAEILYQNGVIKYKGVFELYGNIKEIEENYVAGTYSVSPMMNYKTLFYEFKPKKISGTSWVTIPEGFTVDEIIDLMISYGIGGTKEDYADVINNGEFDYWFVKELDENGWSEDRFYRLEGYLFPDTYEFYNASDAYTVVNKMLRRFSEVYTDAYKARAEEIGFTTDQVVTLASMIEKEAGFSSDFRNVSSVFHNRLNNSGVYPRLESDATVVYAIHHLTGERPTDVTGETISFVSPYNTYQNNGLPPGAIANPGMNALKYALYPADTNYYFFVSSKSGTTLFATNQAGHEANKQSIKNEQ